MRLRDASSAWTTAVPCVGTAPTSAGGPIFPENAHAVIHRPAPSVVSAGGRDAAQWMLEVEQRTRLFDEPLMGWVGSVDPLAHACLLSAALSEPEGRDRLR